MPPFDASTPQDGDPDMPCTAHKACRPAGRPRLDEVETRMQNLVKTALHLFLENGYSNTSLEQIARAAHVAVRTIYVKFGGKIGLLTQVIAAERDRFFHRLESLDTDPRPPAEVLADFAIPYLELVCSPRALCLQRLVIAESQRNPELARTFYDAGPAHTVELLTRYFARPDVMPFFRGDLPPDTLPLLLLSCLLGDRLKRLLFDPETPMTKEEIETQAQIGVRLFLHGTMQPGKN